MKRRQQLDILISSQEELKGRNCLTKTGVAYLDGLKAARKVAFPEFKEKKGLKNG